MQVRKEVGVMSRDVGCCAHLRVEWTTQQLDNGGTRGWWECRDCLIKFAPVPSFEFEIQQKQERLERYVLDVSSLQSSVEALQGDIARKDRTIFAINEEYCQQRDELEAIRSSRDALRKQVEAIRAEIVKTFGGMGSGSPIWGRTQYDKGYCAGIQAALTAFDHHAAQSVLTPEEKQK